MSARIAQLEGEVRLAEEARAELLTQKADLERDLELITAQKEDLARDLIRAEEAQPNGRQAVGADLEGVRAAAEAEMAQAAESWGAKLESTEQTRRALETALAARTSEAGAYEKSHEMWRAHRMTLEAQVSRLKQALDAVGSPTAPRDLPIEVSTVEPAENESTPARNPQREPARWETELPRFARSRDGSEGSLLAEGQMHDLPVTDFVDYAGPSETLLPSSLSPHAEPKVDRPEPAFTPEYEEHGTQPEATSSNVRAWLRSMTDRIRRD